MVAITRPAVEIQQGHLTLYLTYVTPPDFAIPNFFDVDRLEPKKNSGFQRILNETRANRLARHLREGFPKGYANLPTTIFLATDKDLKFDPDRNEITIETEDVCPFGVVDGQHRIEGLIRAANSEPGLSGFRLPATIAVSLDDTHQMYHFYIVNTTQQSVEPALQQQITSRFTDMKGIYDLPYLPHWLETKVATGTDQQGIRLAELLNEEPESPFKGRIQMANDVGGGKSKIKQASLVNMFKQHVFAPVNPIVLRELDPEKRNQIVLNYFTAIDSLLVSDGNREVSRVYTNNGLFFFLVISKWVFTSMYASGLNFTEESITQTLKEAVGEMDPPYHEIADPTWWLPGHGSISLNRANATAYAGEFAKALIRSEESRAHK